MNSPHLRRAVEVAELFADDIADIKTLRAAHAAVGGPRSNPIWWFGGSAALECSSPDTLNVQHVQQVLVGGARTSGERQAQCDLVRDIFGNPFRPVAFDTAWRTDNAVSLARHMYESRDFGAMPILADALQDAGCEHKAVLAHCRDPHQVHVRGCWVVDPVLGKA